MTDRETLPTALPPGNGGLPPGLWPISAALDVAAALDTCRFSGTLGLLTGPSGMGKTASAKALVASLAEGEDGSEAFYVPMTIGTAGMQPGLLRIARAIGAVVSDNMGVADICDGIIRRAFRRPAVIVLDEAQWMSDELLHALRGCWDELHALRCAPGILLIGTPDLAERINGAGGRRKADAFAPFRGRLSLMGSLQPLCDGDFGVICAQHGVAGERATRIIRLAARGRGGLHNVRRLLETARDFAEGGRIGFDALKQAAGVKGIEA